MITARVAWGEAVGEFARHTTIPSKMAKINEENHTHPSPKIERGVVGEVINISLSHQYRETAEGGFVLQLPSSIF